MAKATVTCTCRYCGKTFEKSCIKRNRREADEWESWAMANIDQCPECWAEEKAQIAADKDAEQHLPKLSGSEKQVAWALKIRRRMVDAFMDEAAYATRIYAGTPTEDLAAANIARGWTAFTGTTSAKAYIDAEVSGQRWKKFMVDHMAAKETTEEAAKETTKETTEETTKETTEETATPSTEETAAEEPETEEITTEETVKIAVTLIKRADGHWHMSAYTPTVWPGEELWKGSLVYPKSHETVNDRFTLMEVDPDAGTAKIEKLAVTEYDPVKRFRIYDIRISRI